MIEVSRMNRDLANDYGNLVQRVLTMIQRNCGAQVPTAGAYTDDDDRLLAATAAMIAAKPRSTVRSRLSRYRHAARTTALTA